MSYLDLNQKMMGQYLHRHDFLVDALCGTEDIMEETYRTELVAEREVLEWKIHDLAEKIFNYDEFGCLSDESHYKILKGRGDVVKETTDKMEKIKHVLNLSHPNLKDLRACLEAILTLPKGNRIREKYLGQLCEVIQRGSFDIAKTETLARIKIMAQIIAEPASIDANVALYIKKFQFNQLLDLIPNGPFPDEMIRLAQSFPKSQSLPLLMTMAIRAGNSGQDIRRFVDICRHTDSGVAVELGWELSLLEPFVRDDESQTRMDLANEGEQPSGLLGLPRDALEKIASGLTVQEKASLRCVSPTLRGLQEQVTLNVYRAKKEEIAQLTLFIKEALSPYPKASTMDFDTLIRDILVSNGQWEQDKGFVDCGRFLVGLPLAAIQKIVGDFARLSFPFMGRVFTRFLDELLARKAVFHLAQWDQNDNDIDMALTRILTSEINADEYLVTALEVAFLITDKNTQWAVIEQILTFNPERPPFAAHLMRLICEVAEKAPLPLKKQMMEFLDRQMKERARLAELQALEILQRYLGILQQLATLETHDDYLQTLEAVRIYLEEFFQDYDVYPNMMALATRATIALPIELRAIFLNLIFERYCREREVRPLTPDETTLVASVIRSISDDPDAQAEMFQRIGIVLPQVD